MTEVQVSGNFGARFLVAGWLMARLGLPADRVSMGDAAHVRVRLYAELDGLGVVDGRFGVEREAGTRALRTSSSVDDGPPRVEILPLPPTWASRPLVRALGATGPDPAYTDALHGATRLLVANGPVAA